MYFARRTRGTPIWIRVFNKEEETNETKLHEVQACEELIDGCREEQASCIEAKFGHVERVVAVNEPEEAESNDVEDKDKR